MKESVDCPEIRDSFLQGKIPAGPSVEEHLKWCPHCKELFKNAAALGKRLGLIRPDPVPEIGPVLDAVTRGIVHEKGPRAVLRSLPTKTRLAVSFALAAGLVLVGGIARPRADIHTYPRSLMLAIVVLYVASLGLSVWGVLRPLTLTSPSRPLQLIASLALLISPILVAVSGVHADAAVAPPLGDLVSRSVSCFVYGSALGLPLLVMLWALNRVDRISWPASLLAGASLGITGNLILQLHCPVTHAAHLLLGHALIGIVWAFGYALLSWRRERATRRAAHPA